MTSLQDAVVLDAAEKPLEASKAYEEVLAQGGPCIECYLNLAVLYFVCTDFGYLSHHGLPNDFCRRALGRAHELLDEAEHRFGSHNEIEFWRYYFDYAQLGEPPNPLKTRKLLEKGPSHVPVFHLLMLEPDSSYIAEAEALLREISPPQTERERYIVSVLRSVLSNKAFRNRQPRKRGD